MAHSKRHGCASSPIASCVWKGRSRYPRIARQYVTVCLTANKVTRQCNCSPNYRRHIAPSRTTAEDDNSSSPGPATLLKSISHKISVRAAGVGLPALRGMAFKDEEPGSPMNTQRSRAKPFIWHSAVSPSDSWQAMRVPGHFVDHACGGSACVLGWWREHTMDCFCSRGSTGTAPVGGIAIVLGHIPIIRA